MSDSGVRNWHEECPQLHEFVLVLNKQWAADQDGFQCKLDAAVEQLTDSQETFQDWRLGRPNLRDWATCRRRHFEDKVACEADLRNPDKQETGYVWNSYERTVALQDEVVIQDSLLKNFYCPGVDYKDKSKLTPETIVGSVEISGWMPESLANFDSEKAFHLPTPVGRFAGLNRDHTEEELFLALVVVRDAVCNYSSTVPDDERDDPPPWEDWFSMRVFYARIKAADGWVVSLRAWAEKLGFEVDAGAASKQVLVAVDAGQGGAHTILPEFQTSTMTKSEAGSKLGDSPSNPVQFIDRKIKKGPGGGGIHEPMGSGQQWIFDIRDFPEAVRGSICSKYNSQK